jgi:hypothetical protein
MSLSSIAAAASVATAIFGGHTSQFAPFALRVDDGALTGMLIQADFECDAGHGGASWAGGASFRAGEPQVGENVFAPTSVASDGRFSATGSAVTTYGEDMVGTVTEQLQGTLRGRSARGTYSATLVMRHTDTGATITTCQSGSVSWKARSAPKRLYAGVTTDGLPLVLERSRRKVKIAYIAWTAPCPSGGAWEIGEGLTNFPIAANGRFGDRWDDPPRAYSFRGRIRGSRASGTFGVEVLRLNGDSIELCKSPPARWTARSTPPPA